MLWAVYSTQLNKPHRVHTTRLEADLYTYLQKQQQQQQQRRRRRRQQKRSARIEESKTASFLFQTINHSSESQATNIDAAV